MESECIGHSVVSDSLQSHGLWPTSLLCPWNSPGKNTGVGCHSLLQEIFPTQGSNLLCRQTLYHSQLVRNPPAVWETWVQSLGWEDLLEKGIATHSSILAWRIPWTEEPVGYSPGGCKESDTTKQLMLHFSVLYSRCLLFILYLVRFGHD